MTAFPKYPSYKPSGVEWLGDVPEHWEISRSRRVFTQRKELARKDDQQLSATQAYGVIPQADYEERIGRSVVKISMHLEKRKHVEPDDFVISMRSFQGGLERAWARGAIRSSYTVLEPAIKVAPSYFAYLFKCPQYIGALQATGNFIRDGQDLTYQNYILVDLPLPPLPEQERIGAFLDEKTAEIDRLIAKKQRQIELLDEQKVILINRAVTRGLHPHAELQDSGIPWIGPIPKGWSMPSLKHIARLSSGGTPDRGNLQFWEGGTIPWLKTGEIENNVVFQSEEKITPKALRHSAAKVSPKGTLLMAMYGQGVTRGRVAILGINAAYNQACLAIETGKPALQEYLFWFFRAGYRFLRDRGNETSQMNLNAEAVGGMKVLHPPSNELAGIARCCQDIEQQIELIRQKVESQIQTLQTLRSTLIAHAVTGKIAIPAATA